MPAEDYDDELYCEECRRYTAHRRHSDGHERDSSGDYSVCKLCGKLTRDQQRLQTLNATYRKINVDVISARWQAEQ